MAQQDVWSEVEDTHTDTQTDGRDLRMKYAAEMGSGVMTYTHIPSFIKIGSGIQKIMWKYTDSKLIS
jgi:hypothetical protein